MAGDQLLLAHQAIDEMLAEQDLAARLRVVARTLHRLGWDCVSLSVVDKQDGAKLAIVEPSREGLALEEVLQAHAEAERYWQEDKDSSLEKVRAGTAYVLPRKELVSEAQKSPTSGSPAGEPGDRLLIPIHLGDGQLAGTIYLDHSSAPHTEERVQALGLLTAQARVAIENSRLQRDLEATTQNLQTQIEELVMLQRVDEELSATLNFDNVMMLTMDWALRRTGATAGMLNMVTPDGSALIPVSALGYPLDVLARETNNPLPFTRGIVGRAARTREIQIVRDVKADPDYLPLLDRTRTELAVPLEMRGRLLGVLNLESEDADTFESVDISFIRRLASRAAVALDNARLYRETEQRADEMAALYSASRVISSSLERSEVLINVAQALAAVLSVSGIIIADYHAEYRRLTITAAYRLGTARNTPDKLPAVGDVFEVDTLPELQHVVRGPRSVSLQASDPTLSAAMRAFLNDRQFRSVLVAPLTVQTQVFGVAMLVEGRRERQFTTNEILMTEALASQAAAALRQARLYEDVRELEKLKSEMIRMASHDLRNPLGNAMGYLEMLLMAVGKSLSKDQLEYVANIKRSTTAMKSLIEDLLTLERVDSERQLALREINLSELVHDVVEAQQLSADLQQQSLTVKTDSMDLWVAGSTTQLRQAMTNLISNGIKYTPANGRIDVKLRQEDSRLIFEVHDSGYGISKERQERLFQRFYRAHEPGTDHIAGTGLGLSLVKTVVERHGGNVWVESEPGKGSTFGLWLPALDPSKLKQKPPP
jgi:signal transduction histidine kinase